MNKQSRTTASQHLLRAIAEISADIATDTSEACGYMDGGSACQDQENNRLAACGALLQTPEKVQQLLSLIGALLALNQSRVV